MSRLAAALLLVTLGCGRAPTAAIDLTVIAGPSLPDDVLASMQSLSFTVGGVESAQASYTLAHPFADHRQERVVYQPRARAGNLLFTVEASDPSGAPVAGGQTTVALGVGHAIAASVTLAEGAVSPDLGTPPDLAGFCATASDGTACGSADACNDAPLCQGGACVPLPKADGTSCGSANSCNMVPTCVAGVCTPHPLADGIVCAPTANVCQNAGKCSAGVCGAITDKVLGTVCSPKVNACHTDGVCNGKGTCGAQGVHPDGYNYNGVFLDRCCGGNPVSVNTAQNCGACGINCNGGSCVSAHGGPLYCTCASNAMCWSNCCSTFFGAPYVCAAGNCSTNQMIPCPGNAINSNNPNGPYYCHY
jgi:hypothetical protein